jgi:hypothetical protein
MTQATERALVRRLRRHLPLPVITSRPGITLREVAEHEAAHVVVAVALGGAPLLVHVGNSFGGVVTSFGGIDGMLVSITSPEARGPVAVAGMVWDKSARVGPADGAMLLEWLSGQLGPWPSREPRRVAELIREASRRARVLLRTHRAAVLAVAGEIEAAVRAGEQPVDGDRLARAARRTSPNLSAVDDVARGYAQAWRRALGGDAFSESVVAEIGLGMVLQLTKTEIGRRSGAASPSCSRPAHLVRRGGTRVANTAAAAASAAASPSATYS